MTLGIIILYFLLCVKATPDCRKRKIEEIEKELIIDRIILLLNDEGIYIPPIKNKIGLKNDSCFMSYSNNLSLINTAHKKLDEDLINFVLDMSNDSVFYEAYSNDKSEHSFKPKLDFVVKNRTLHEEYEVIGEQKEFQKIKFDKYLPNISSLEPKRSEFYKNGIDIHFKSFDYSCLTDQSKVVETAAVQYKSYPSSSSNSKFLKHKTSSRDYITEIYLKIINHCKSILSKSHKDWLIVRFGIIKEMINPVKHFKRQKLDSSISFIVMLDEKIMLLLDKLNLRTCSILIKYDLVEYTSFIGILTECLHELKIYSFVVEYFFKHNEEVLRLSFEEFVFLFKFFPDFPELLTLGSLLKHNRDERLLIYFRVIHLLILENESRKEKIKTVILFLMKKSFLTPKKRTRELDFISKDVIDIKKHFKETSLCNKNHSELCFFMWEFHPNKNRTMRYNGKVDGGYVYFITVSNMEYFRDVLLSFLFQHIMFIEYHNLKPNGLEKLFNKSFSKHICAFCLFREYLDLVRAELSLLKVK